MAENKLLLADFLPRNKVDIYTTGELKGIEFKTEFDIHNVLILKGLKFSDGNEARIYLGKGTQLFNRMPQRGTWIEYSDRKPKRTGFYWCEVCFASREKKNEVMQIGFSHGVWQNINPSIRIVRWYEEQPPKMLEV